MKTKLRSVVAGREGDGCRHHFFFFVPPTTLIMMCVLCVSVCAEVGGHQFHFVFEGAK